MVTFSVVICAYAEERWPLLVEAVRSVQRQTLSPQQVVVVVDHNESLFVRARRELDGVVVVPNEDDRGLRGARNAGVQAATASCVAFMDDDAEADERWLAVLAEPYEDPNVAGVGGLTQPVWDGGRPDWFPEEFEWVVGGAYRGMPVVRQDVRNLWGGNMSFRVDPVREIGGFRIGYSCDDTELCIRLRQRWPERRFVFTPDAVVLHHIDRARMTPRRFVSRCHFEGGSKAVISRLVGAQDALASERRYTTKVLPVGFARSLRDFITRRDVHALAHASFIVAGFTGAAFGYVTAMITPRSAARKRGWTGEPIGTSPETPHRLRDTPRGVRERADTT
jgi:glycosyltransferase involved in cell wall biosynthesis